MTTLAAAVELVSAVDTLRVLDRAGRVGPDDVYRVALAHARFTGRDLRSVGNSRGRVRSRA